jgi:hypothetical protein
MGLGDIFDEAFDLYKQNFLFLLLVAALVAVPAQVLAPVLALRFPGEPSLARLIAQGIGSVLPPHTLDSLGPVLNGPAIFAPLYPLASGVEVTALAGACSLCYLGEPRTLWAAYRVPLRRIVPLALTLLLQVLFTLLGFVLCYVGVLVPLTLLAFTAHTFALEGRNFGKALGRSNQLVSGYGGRVFGCLCLLWLISFVVGLGVRMPLMYAFDVALNVTPGRDLLFGGQGAVTALDQQRRIVADVCGGLTDLLLFPFTFCVLTVLYYDLRIRKEAFDVALLARGLGYPPLTALDGSGYLPPVTPVLPPRAAPARPAKTPPPPPVMGGPRR